MREHSGGDPGSNTNRDPTLKDQAGRGGPGERDAAVAAAGNDTVGVPREQGGELSPSARGRGETADGGSNAPVDLNRA